MGEPPRSGTPPRSVSSSHRGREVVLKPAAGAAGRLAQGHRGSGRVAFSESPPGRALFNPASPAEHLLLGADDERPPLDPFHREEPPEADQRYDGGREVRSPSAFWTARKPGQQGKGKGKNKGKGFPDREAGKRRQEGQRQGPRPEAWIAAVVVPTEASAQGTRGKPWLKATPISTQTNGSDEKVGPPGAVAQEESLGGLPLHLHGSPSTGIVRPVPLRKSMSTVSASTSSQTSSRAWTSPSLVPSCSSVSRERHMGLVKQQAITAV